jgi:F-type H+-transporting ATPase subunit b
MIVRRLVAPANSRVRRLEGLLLMLFGLCFTRPAVALSHDAHASVASDSHVAAAADEPVSAGHGEHEEAVSVSDINWIYGLVGERDHVEPSLLWRPTGMPAPFLATCLNWLVLVSLIVVFARKQLPAALKKRKANIVSGMEEAGRVKSQAENRLNELEGKLSHVDEEMERIKADMRRTSELERERILREAEERRLRLERDASRLIETELEGAKEDLRREVVEAALQQATQEVSRQLTAQDQQSLFDEALGSLGNLPSKSLGGRA